MPTPQLSSLNPNATLDELKDYLIGLNRYLNYLLSSLDTLNISRLDAKVIVANTITAGMLNVTELSAISANMGTITAGSITANAEINVGTDVNVGRFLNINAVSASGDNKAIIFKDAGSNVGSISSLSGDLSINATGNILLGGSDSYANGGRIATEGISVTISVMGGDGITPMTLHFDGGTLSSVV